MKKNANKRIRKWVGTKVSQATLSVLEHKLKKLHPVCTPSKYAL